ncbi:DnaD domain-containing protein [Desulfofalx alkaliphila]|uniref:DnaD domain-containing protein n=1 Tax=Desulfofalx alkaliphila TaxID=105483 RepID=UPI00146FADB7|nr:DnaD domain protein [Desulfofalx alkaliphila]
MAINNKAGWTVEFAVAVSVLCVKTGLSPRAIANARNELKQKGRIDWKQRKGNQSAVYRMIPFLSATGAYNRTDNGTRNDLSAPHADSCADNTSYNTSDKCADNASTLYKLNKTKLNNDHDHARARARTTDEPKKADNVPAIIVSFEGEFGRPLSPMEVQHIREWTREFTDEMLLEALKRASLAGRPTVAYIRGILTNWKKNNVRTLRDVAELDRQFKERRGVSKTEGQAPPAVDDEKKRLYDALLMS